MGLDQKERSLHCGLQSGLGFEIIEGDSVLLLKNVPFELEDIAAKWIAALPVDYIREPDAFVKLYLGGKELGFTESGWGAFVNWLTDTLRNAQFESEFHNNVRISAINYVS